MRRSLSGLALEPVEAMGISESPISPIKGPAESERIRVSWTLGGLVLMGLGIVLFLVGMWRVDGVMAAMGLAVGGLFLVAWVLGRGNLSGLFLEFRAPRRVAAGRSFAGRLKLRNLGRLLDGFWIDFGIVVMGEKDLVGRVLWLDGGGAVEIEGRVNLSRRGSSMTQRGYLESIFPLGLLTFRREFAVEAEMGVLPGNQVPREMRVSGYLLDGTPLGGSRNFGGIGEWKGLREWRGGDAVRRIAWTASLKSEAAGGGLLVREDDPPGSQAEGCLVIFHSYGGDGSLIRPDRFERALALLGGTLGFLQGLGMPVRWVADFTDWEENEIKTRRQVGQMREALIGVQRTAGTEAHDVVAAVEKARDCECVVIISDMPLAVWEGAVPRTPLKPVLVDITNYDGSSRMGGRKKGGAR